MIKTLKSELKLRPTYAEMIGMIESQGDPNRPSVEQVIDRKATIFRNNQFGSQFDNIDFLGLKKQEEDKLKQEQRNLQLRQTAVGTGASMGILSARPSGVNTPSGLNTPAEVYEDAMLRPEPSDEDLRSILAIMATHLQEQDRAREETVNMARNDLDVANTQTLPVGVEVHRIATDDDLPPLEPIPQSSNLGYPQPLPPPPTQTQYEEEEEELTALEQKVAFTKEYNPDEVIANPDITYKGLMFQLHVRDLLTDEMIGFLNKIPTDDKKKRYLASIIEGLYLNDEWDADFSSDKLSRKIKEFKNVKERVGNKRIEPSASSSSGGGIGSAIASGAKAVGGAVSDAGKEAVKEAVVAGARSAVMSLI